MINMKAVILLVLVLVVVTKYGLADILDLMEHMLKVTIEPELMKLRVTTGLPKEIQILIQVKKGQKKIWIEKRGNYLFLLLGVYSFFNLLLSGVLRFLVLSGLAISVEDATSKTNANRGYTKGGHWGTENGPADEHERDLVESTDHAVGCW